MRKDNQTFRQKVSLRLRALAKLGEKPSVMETHGGRGLVYGRCYAQGGPGVVFEKNAERAEGLARQRPRWAVYQADSERALVAGIGFQFRPNVFDIDPYGSPWNTIAAVAGQFRQCPDRVLIVVNDGLRKKLQIKGGWKVECLRKEVEAIGNDRLHADYLEVCRTKLTRIVSAVGFGLLWWDGYHCGTHDAMTHYAAVLGRGTRG